MSQFINTALLPISLAIIMLGIGLSVKWSDFSALKQQKSAIIGGFALQVIGLPLLALTLIALFDIRGEYAVAMMIVACCPGGVTSNALTFIFSGVVALSVVLTLLSSIVAPLTIPLITDWSLGQFVGESAQIDFSLLGTVGKLFILSIVPIVIGNIIQRFAPVWCASHGELLRKLAGGLFLTVIVLMAIVNFDKLGDVIRHLGLFIIIMVCCAIALGYWGGKLFQLNAKQRLTLAIEVGIQNAGMGLIITGAVLNNPTMSIALIAYGIVMQLPMLIFATIVKQRNQSVLAKG